MLKNIERLQIKSSQIAKKYLLRKKTPYGLFYSSGRKNIGDSISPWLVEKVARRAISYSNPLETNGPQLLAIGSILESATKDCTVWGSGFIKHDSHPKQEPREITAVRGPLTAARLTTLGMKSTKIYGDPAILLPKYAEIGQRKNANKIGLIPHYVDRTYLAESKIFRSPRALFVDIETDDLNAFLLNLRDCEIVISSSLHGIIIAEAYGIPAIWAKFDNRLKGGSFKFHDYYLSTGRNVEPDDFYSIDEAKASKAIRPPFIIGQLAQDLLDAFPRSFQA